MKISVIAEKMGWQLLAGAGGADRQVQGFYAGDLLSWVMGRAKEGNLWFTVMGNVNTIAVATLSDVSGIILTDSAALDADAKARADMQDIPIYSASQNTWEAIIEVHEATRNESV